jgi:bacterioferritin (cytochrome b1)
VVSEEGPAPETRRGLVRIASGGVGALAALGLAACGSSSKSKSKSNSNSNSMTSTSATSSTAATPDVPILNSALELEQMAIVAYTAATPLLSGSAHLAAQRFLSQELAHAGELAGLVKQAGGEPSKSKASYDLGNPQTTEDVLLLLHRIEQAQLAVYSQAIPLLSKPSSRAAVAAIFGNDAQHASVIALALGDNPVPSAFVGAGK